MPMRPAKYACDASRSDALGRRVVVSLTSYPPRIQTVRKAILSLLRQDRRPDLVVLYLSRDEFPRGTHDLPIGLRGLLLRERSVELRWVEGNLKPHKKYFYALREFPEDLVVTADDDLIYRKSMLTELLDSYRAHPHAISAMRAHLIRFADDGQLAPYADWLVAASIKHPRLVGVESMRLFVTTGAGTLFPPHCLPPDAFDEQAVRETCLEADDVWINVVRQISHTKVVAATTNRMLTCVPGTQESGLYHENLRRGGNDVVLRAVFERLADRGASPAGFVDDSIDALL